MDHPSVPPEPPRVFVYGTLRIGERYRYLIEAEVVKTCPGTVAGRLFHYAPPGERGEWPYLVPGEGRVVGELLEFRDFGRALAILDEVEDYPELYLREVVPVELEGASEPTTAWVYLLRPEKDPGGLAIPGGDWVAAARGRDFRN